MGLRIDEEHGLNPSLDLCFYCNESKGVALMGKLTKKTREGLKEAGITDGGAEAPRQIVIDKEPCDKCKGYMEQGVLLISVDESKSPDMENPWRTGGWIVVKDEVIQRMGIHPRSLEEAILRKRVCFMPDEVWDMMGLPRGEVEGVPSR